MINKRIILILGIGGIAFLGSAVTVSASSFSPKNSIGNIKIVGNQKTYENSKVISTLPEPGWYKNAVVKYSFAGVQQDRQDLGIVVKQGGKIRIRQSNSDYSGNLTLRMYGKDRNDESTVSIGKDWVEVTAKADLVPFIDTPWDSKEGAPKLDYQIDEKDEQQLEVFKAGENEKEFFEQWQVSKAPYALFKSDRIQMLTPFKDLDSAQIANNKAGISSYLTKYNDIISSDDQDTGLDDSSPWNEKSKTRIFVKEDDKGNSGGSTAFSVPEYIATEGTMGLFFKEFWPHLEHEIGHEYQIGVGEAGLGGNGGLYTTEITNEVVLGLRYMKDKDYFWDTYSGPSGAEAKTVAEDKMYQSLIDGGKKYGDLPDSEKIILMALMFQRAGNKSSIPFYQSIRKLISTPGFNKNNQNFSTQIQKELSQVGKVNYTPLLERLGGNTNKNEEKNLKSTEIPKISMLADIVPKEELSKAREILDSKYSVKSNFMIVTNKEISSLGLKGNLSIDLTDCGVKDGESYVLTDAGQIASEAKIQNEKLYFKDVPNGVYELEKADGEKTLGKIKYVYIKNSENSSKVDPSTTSLELTQNRVLYEKNEVLNESEILKEAGATTESTNSLSIAMDNDISSQLGEHTVKVSATNPVTGEIVTKDLILNIVEPKASLTGSLNFTDNDALKVNASKEVQLNLKGLSSNLTDIKKITLSHHFESNDLNLGNTIEQKLPGKDWESQEIDVNQPLSLTLDQIKPNEDYSVKYDIIASKNINLSKGDQWEVNYTYENEDNGIKKTYTKAINLSLELKTESDSDNNTATTVKSNGMITFKDDNQPTYPVDPVNPVQPIVPDQPINPNGAELMITYASDLNFGKQSKSETSWHALADSVKDQVNSDSSRSVVPFISVKDSRGTNRNGWKLEVTKDDDFKDDEGNILKGADLTYSNLNYADQINMPVATSGSVTLSQSASVIAQADSTQGAGNTSLALGRLGENDQTSGVTLSVLPGTLINTKIYRTTITYELVAGV